MKKTLGRRCLSLFLTLAMCLALAPAAWAADTYRITGRPADDVLETGDKTTLRLMLDSGDTQTEASEVEWRSSDPDVASVGLRTGEVTGVGGGEVKITAYVSGRSVASVDFTVRGIAVRDSFDPNISVGISRSLNDAIRTFGVSRLSLEFTSRNTSIAVIDEDNRIKGLQEGDVEIIASASSATRKYTVSFTVHVSAPTIEAGTIATNGTLPFSELSSFFASQIGGNVEYVTGLFVSTSQGTLYYGYQSEDLPGAGVGQSQNYYLNPGAGQQALDDVTFVPKSTYAGGSVTITYTAVTKDYMNYACKIILTVQGVDSSSGSSPATDGISLTTAYNTAVKFDSQTFGAVCRELFGVQLDYVTFSQPPERQGTLYTNYSSAGNYGSVVDLHGQYSRKDIDDIWFVPAPGYAGGTVTVYYTGFSSNGKSYTGQVFIKVEQENHTATGGLSYTIFSGSMARFDEADFDDFCRTILDSGKSVSGIRFDSLPSESDGVLYYDYRSSVSPGTPVTVGTVYYTDTRTPRIDRLVFVPAEGYIGTIKLPFTGWTTDGASFGGNVEVNVRGGVSAGDIYYYCAPGRSVSFRSSDFTNLSRTMTNYTLDYIILRDIPAFSEGYLYIGNSRINSAGSRYYTSDISRLSFRASNTFSGLVIIPFEGYSRYGYPFTGVVTIGNSTTSPTNSTTASNTTTSNNTTSSSPSTIDAMAQYSASTAPVRFYDADLAQSGSSLSYIRFTSLPPSGAGYLYYQYATPTQYGQQVTTGTTYRVTGGNLISDLSFVPRAGYAGTVVIPYTGTNTSGTTFSGEVVITVSPTYSSYYFNDMAGYNSAQVAAVDFLYDHGITHGMSAGQYGPENQIRRGDFALMLYQAFEFYPVSSGTSFSDVSSGAYYATAVNTLYARGIVSGVGSGRFAPDSTLTRQDAICMVQRAMQAIGWSAGDGYVSSLSGYGDSASVSDYALGAMSLAVQRGYLPTSGGLLNPQQPLTRVDMAELIHRALTY